MVRLYLVRHAVAEASGKPRWWFASAAESVRDRLPLDGETAR